MGTERMKRRLFLQRLGKQATAGAVLSTLINPFEVGRSADSVYRNRLVDTPSGPPDSPLTNGSRRLSDGIYQLHYEWIDTTGWRWQIAFNIERRIYTDAEAQSWGYLQAFRAAQTNPTARRLGEQFATATPASGSVGDTLTAADHLECVVGFVTALEYAVDPDTKGVPEYHRMPEETLVDGQGDCKDLTYLLAGILSQPPFEYRTAMVLLPGHMLLGVHSADLPAAYDDVPTLPDGEFVAIETTPSWPIGTFTERPVLAIYHNGFSYVDTAAIGKTTRRFLRDPTAFDVVANLS